MTPLLEVSGLHAFYGKSHVLHGVDLDVHAGEILALLGRNGVGRSTTLKAIMGMIQASGAIRLRGENLLASPTFKRARRGLGYVAETRDVFPTLTVEQNLMLGARTHSGSARWQREDMYQLFPRLHERQHTRAGVLSGGEQQMLSLCRAMIGDPDIVLIDEPTEGLAPKIVEQVGDFLRAVQARGVAIVLVEQKRTIALKLAQRVVVLGHGQSVFCGTPAELDAAHEVRREWLDI